MIINQANLATWIEPITQRPLGEIAVIESLAGNGPAVRVMLPFALTPKQSALWAHELGIASPLHTVIQVGMKVPAPTLTVPADSPLSAVKHCIAVISGKGGVGKSTVTTNVACALAQLGLKVGVLDADIYGPSQGMMLGASIGQRPEIEKGAMKPVPLHGVQSMSMAYLVTENTPMVWRGPMATGALLQLLNQTLWGELDVLLVDMPPGTGDIALTLAQKVPLSGGVVVTTPQDIALLDAKKGIEMLGKVKVPVLGIIENMSVHICEHCGHQDAIFGVGGGASLVETYESVLLAQTPLNRTIREDMDAGTPTVVRAPDDALSEPFVIAAQRLLVALNESQADVGPVISIV